MVHGEVQFGFKIAVKHKIHAKIWQILFWKVDDVSDVCCWNVQAVLKSIKLHLANKFHKYTLIRMLCFRILKKVIENCKQKWNIYT